jgi:tetratricopeptide (TPR) repeat protein
MLALRFCILFIFCHCLWGQNNTEQLLQQASGFEDEGRFEKALDILRPLVGSQQVNAVEAGKIWISMGYANQGKGDFASARRCYEQAAHIFRHEPSGKANYGAALDNLADWYRATGNLRAARKLEKNALEQYQQAGDHAGAAWALMHLAVIELTGKRLFDAQQDVDEADREAGAASNRSDDFVAALYSAEGWLEALEGNTSTVIFDYSQSLAFRACKSCMLTGWEYVLLGKAYVNDGQLNNGLDDMRKGLVILSSTSGQHSLWYLAAQIAYAHVLDNSGEHAKSVALKAAAERELNALDRGRCASCREGFVAMY